jgi:hypothetical protein
MRRLPSVRNVWPLVITLNLVLGTAMLIGLSLGTPAATLIAVPLIFLNAVSAVVLLSRR